MKAIKKINNNVAVCLDDDGHELIVLGKGLGFPKMPYEIKDLKKIERTFYDIKQDYFKLLNDIPSEVIEFTAKMVDVAVSKLPYRLNPNLVLTLADHIEFSLQRMRKDIKVHMPLNYDIAQTYPMETSIGEYIVSQIQKEFYISLPKQEVFAIAMHFVYGREKMSSDEVNEQWVDFEALIEKVTQLIEDHLKVHVDKRSFSYARLVTHLQYLFNRVQKHESIKTENFVIYESLNERFPKVAECVEEMATVIDETLECTLSEEEKLYLILHVNRVCMKEGL